MPERGGAHAAPEIGGGSDVRVAKILFGKYEVGRLLGCGAFAKVYHARHTASGQSVALKVISKPRVVRGGLVSNVKREIAAMRRVRHPHVVRLHEVLASRTRVYFVMELARGGELFTRLARAGRLPEDSARLLFRQLLSAVAFCHSRGVFHRDLKPENLLLDEAGKLKVSDFGLSAIAADQIRADGLLHTLCGTPAYVAPEILSKKGYDGAKADIWSCGVILFVLNAGYLPFNDPNLMAMYRKIYRGDYRCPKWTSLELKQLISRMLDSNPETRITVEGILRDPWFRKGLQDDELNAMMRTDEEVEYKLSKGNNCGVEMEEERDLNAFDIISFSSGFDLSGLFVARPGRERFVSCEPAESVLERVLEVAQNEELVVRRPKECKPGRGAAAVERPIGGLVAWVEIYRLTRGLVVVEVELGGAATENGRWGGEFWREKLVPVLNRPTGGEPGSSASGSVGDRFDRIHEVDSGCKSVPDDSG